MVAVHIADDHAVMVELLIPVVNGSGIAHINGSSLTLSECRKALVADLPDILLLDINMLDGNGIDVLFRHKYVYLWAHLTRIRRNE